MSRIIFSIVICTHNRADVAREAIASVLGQAFLHEEYELLIIDNASMDATCQMAQKFCDAYSNVRYIMEPNIGLSHARNRGWQEARGEYVGYLDDDCKAPLEWLSAARRVAAQIQPEVFGGPYYPFYNTPKPAWFKDKYGSNFQGAVARSLNDNEYISGGNMFIRRSILSQLEGFYSNLGMEGKKKGYGEETNFFIRLRSKLNNPIIYYDPKIFVYHLVRPEKFRLSYIISASFVGGRQYYNVLENSDQPHVFFTLQVILSILLEIFKSLTLEILSRDRRAYPFAQNYVYECTSILVSRLGYQVERLKTAKGLF